MANQKCVASHSDDSEPPELPRPAPHPSSKPHLELFSSTAEAATGPVLALKSLQRERMLYKQRLQSGRSSIHNEDGGWKSERTAHQRGRIGPQEREEEQTQRVQPFARRREHSKTAAQLQSLPTQILLLGQDSEEPRQCPSPVQQYKYPGSSHISPVKYSTGRKPSDWSPVKTQRRPREGLARVPLASWLQGIHTQKAK